jgi:hypothetical protein
MTNGLSFEEVQRIKEEFQKEYFFKEPFSAHVNMCGISKVGIKDKNSPADQKDDFCISVGLRNPLPSDISLPSEYQGVRVLVQVIGEIRPL